MSSDASSMIYLYVSDAVSGQTVQQLVTEWQAGTAFIELEVSTRQQYWKQLPWAIVGVCSVLVDPARARRWAQHCLAMWDQSVKSPAGHHRLTTLWFAGVVDTQLRRFAHGESIAVLPELKSLLSQLALIPIVERIQEGAHAVINHNCVNRRVSLANVSIVIRLPEILQAVETNHPFMLEAFKRYATISVIAQSWGFCHHPAWAAALEARAAGEAANRPNFDKLLDVLFYSHSAEDRFERHAFARMRHQIANKLRRQRIKQLQKSIGVATAQTTVGKTSQGRLELLSTRDHLRRRFCASSLYSLPSHADCIHGLDACLGAPGAHMQPTQPSAAPEYETERDVSSLLVPATMSAVHDPCLTKHTFFRVIHTTPSKGRHVKAGIATNLRLQAGDVAIALYKVWQVGESLQCALSPEATVLTVASSGCVRRLNTEQ